MEVLVDLDESSPGLQKKTNEAVALEKQEIKRNFVFKIGEIKPEHLGWYRVKPLSAFCR